MIPPSSVPPTPWPELRRVRLTVVFIDVVESVRLMREHEDAFIDRWRRFVAEVQTEVLVRHGGRMVKSLGDGLLLEFAAPSPALAATVDMQRRAAARNAGRPAAEQLWLRASVHCTDVAVESFDLLGSGVNLGARLATLARPGDIVLSVEARDELVPALDPAVEDLGECWLKHFDRPVRAFRVVNDPATGQPLPPAATAAAASPPLSLGVAVIPPRCLAGAADDAVIGELVADGLIGQLSRTPELTVVSRLSTSALRERELATPQLHSLTGARFAVSGSYLVHGEALLLTIELADTATQAVCWAERFKCRVADLLEQPCEPLDRIAQQVHRAILDTEAREAATQALPNLASYSLLYGGIGLLHRSSPAEFGRAREALAALAERVPRHGAPHAWLAKWHCMRIARGLAPAAGEAGIEARWQIERALECDPGNALAWALRGLVSSWIDRDLDGAAVALQEALARNANEPLAWLYTCSLRSWQGRGAEAVQAAGQALRLSPLDPMRYYFETMAAAAHLTDGDLATAIELCQRSLRTNRTHTPTHRVLAVSLVKAGRLDEARATVRQMLALQPDLTVARYLQSYPGGRVAHALAYAEALREAGLPA